VQSRLKVDGVNIDFISNHDSGPISWVTNGVFDVLATIDVPVESEREMIDVVKDHLKKDDVSELPHSDRFLLANYVSIHLKLCLKNLQALIPLQTEDISYVNNALIRPIVGYMNTHNTHIPLEFYLKMNREHFNGAWTLNDSGLADAISHEVGISLVRLVYNERERSRRLRKIGLWFLQNVSKSLIALWHAVNAPSPVYDDDYLIS
jgi:mitochondrial distribution and morphology protein 31